ncbi:MAG: peptide deformylase [Streptosporangiales bacterium]
MTYENESAEDEPREVRVQGAVVDSYPEVAPEALRGAVRRVTEIGEAVLHRPCREVTEVGTAALHQLVDDMFLTMYVAEGVGLAANQMGVDLRVFVYDCGDEDGVRHVGHLVNPVLEGPVEESLAQKSEGCLSVPGPHADLARLDRMVARGADIDGRPVAIEGAGYFARCLQHETDHLNGRLYVDLLDEDERTRVLDEMKQMRDEVIAEREANAAVLLDS